MNETDDDAASDREAAARPLCYFLVCYKNATYVHFLLSSLYRPQDLFIIHCDIKAPASLISLVNRLAADCSNIKLLPSQSYSWAGFSHVRISFQAIDAALSSGTAWSHFVFLSEEHLPLRSPEAISSALQPGRSAFWSIAAARYGGSQQKDISNRFALVFRELPGVGCFATQIRDNPQKLLAGTYHGSNWIILSRRHCDVLQEMSTSGLLNLYETVVHSEELAINTMLSAYAPEIDNVDRVLVALPHLTDNHSLVMTESLFLESLKDPVYLFIRKRSLELSPKTLRHIRSNHSHDFGLDLSMVEPSSDNSPFRDEFFRELCNHLKGIFNSDVSVEILDKKSFAPSPQVHFSIKHSLLPDTVTIRILSEDLAAFKVAIVEDTPFFGEFDAPERSETYMRSTLRVRVYGLFGNTEVLPANLPSAGFVDNVSAHEYRPLLQMIDDAVASSLEIFASRAAR